MNALFEAAELLTSFIEIFVFILAASFFAERRFRVSISVIATVVLSASITALAILLNQIILVTLLFVPVFLVLFSLSLLIIYKIDYLKALTLSIIYLVIINAFDFCANSFIELFFGRYGMTAEAMNAPGLTRTILILSYKAVLVIALIVFARLRKNKPKIKISRKNCVLLMITGVLLFACMYFLMIALATGEANQIKKSIFFAWLFMLLLVIGSILLIAKNESERRRKAEEQILENKINALEGQITQSVEAYKNIAALSHDHKNHLRTISLLVDNGKSDEAKQYIESINEESAENDVKIISVTGIDSVDAIINIKRTQCTKCGIEFSLDSSMIAEEHISNIDFCALVMNLLDNAIEAVMRIGDGGKRKIELKISVWEEKLLIKVSNTYDPNNVIQTDKLFETSKSDKNNHGYGLMIIKRIVEKNGGVYNIKQDELFSVSILI